MLIASIKSIGALDSDWFVIQASFYTFFGWMYVWEFLYEDPFFTLSLIFMYGSPAMKICFFIFRK